jgi:hypothetical protein
MFMPKSDRFAKDKAEMLNAYREMNKAVAESYGCPYIDMRQAFLDAIPSYRLNYKVNQSNIFAARKFLRSVGSFDRLYLTKYRFFKLAVLRNERWGA